MRFKCFRPGINEVELSTKQTEKLGQVLAYFKKHADASVEDELYEFASDLLESIEDITGKGFDA